MILGDSSHIPEGVVIGFQSASDKTPHSCAYRANVSTPWTSDSTCTLVVFNKTSFYCNCTHLTEFTVFSVSEEENPDNNGEEVSKKLFMIIFRMLLQAV